MPPPACAMAEQHRRDGDRPCQFHAGRAARLASGIQPSCRSGPAKTSRRRRRTQCSRRGRPAPRRATSARSGRSRPPASDADRGRGSRDGRRHHRSSATAADCPPRRGARADAASNSRPAAALSNPSANAKGAASGVRRTSRNSQAGWKPGSRCSESASARSAASTVSAQRQRGAATPPHASAARMARPARAVGASTGGEARAPVAQAAVNASVQGGRRRSPRRSGGTHARTTARASRTNVIGKDMVCAASGLDTAWSIAGQGRAKAAPGTARGRHRRPGCDVRAMPGTSARATPGHATPRCLASPSRGVPGRRRCRRRCLAPHPVRQRGNENGPHEAGRRAPCRLRAGPRETAPGTARGRHRRPGCDVRAMPGTSARATPGHATPRCLASPSRRFRDADDASRRCLAPHPVRRRGNENGPHEAGRRAPCRLRAGPRESGGGRRPGPASTARLDVRAMPGTSARATPGHATPRCLASPSRRFRDADHASRRCLAPHPVRQRKNENGPHEAGRRAPCRLLTCRPA